MKRHRRLPIHGMTCGAHKISTENNLLLFIYLYGTRAHRSRIYSDTRMLAVVYGFLWVPESTLSAIRSSLNWTEKSDAHRRKAERIWVNKNWSSWTEKEEVEVEFITCKNNKECWHSIESTQMRKCSMRQAFARKIRNPNKWWKWKKHPQTEWENNNNNGRSMYNTKRQRVAARSTWNFVWKTK